MAELLGSRPRKALTGLDIADDLVWSMSLSAGGEGTDHKVGSVSGSFSHMAHTGVWCVDADSLLSLKLQQLWAHQGGLGSQVQSWIHAFAECVRVSMCTNVSMHACCLVSVE